MLILTHNMFGIGDPKISWMKVMHHEEDAVSLQKESHEVTLVGGSKYHLKMLVYHSVHNEFTDAKESYAKLKW